MIQLLISGLAMGSIYALVALGIVVIANAVNVVNFAQGENVMLGAYVAATLTLTLHLPILAAYVISIILLALYGYIFQKVAYYPLRKKPFITVVVATIGVSMFLKNAARIIWGPQPIYFAGPFGESMIRVGGISINAQNILIIVVTLALVVFQHFFFAKTSLGRQMQATAQDQEAATLMGIKVSRMIAFTFIYSSMLAAAAGVLLAPIFYVSADMGANLGLKAFAASIIGGFGSVPGAILGGLFLGVLEIFAAAYVSSLYKDAFAFIVLILILAFMPRGLFGEKISTKV
ncbi:MAG: branched-chain amino acid ABC transporter permease [Desulfitobacteriaceae bacterium]|nr:branched-chain amino acid ABC transporter permease [Desulfitobacteriaceae bacterium]MDI6877851.1 branched-chain amino acid ABC transporter permease [Desulfitobacteriaceae bacterium]MDI6912748.1 branched-chain amino acid ABC transporter permease [Desulfitobacteriaceae bacterium]